ARRRRMTLVRPGSRQDVPFMRDMLRHAGYERAGVPLVAEAPPLSRYVSGWGRAGDVAVIALDETTRQPVGAAWYRLFPADEPAYGFVDERTPELSMAVVPRRRREGIGAQLIEALIEQARQDGHPALSLAVERDSPALGFYERYGFARAQEHGE